ncbi:MAG: hypothetical protein WAX38_00795 [Minisyncoccia bacterium]
MNKGLSFLVTLLLFFGSYAVLIILKERIYLLLPALLIISGLMLYIDGKREKTYVYLMMAVFAPIGDVVAHLTGLWVFADDSFLNLPIWLPFMYGNASLVVIRLFKYFEHRS